MTRIGFETRSTKENVQEILQAISLPGLEAEGAFTHFAVADVNGGEEFTELQYRRFVDMCLELEKHGVNLMYRHCSNSAAIFSTHRSLQRICIGKARLIWCVPALFYMAIIRTQIPRKPFRSSRL